MNNELLKKNLNELRKHLNANGEKGAATLVFMANGRIEYLKNALEIALGVLADNDMKDHPDYPYLYDALKNVDDGK